MKFEKEASLHNKFEIEVRDIRTGEIKQKAYAHNLVTNYGLQRALRGWFLSYGQYICIGRLATAPKPTNIKLNSQIGYKVSTLEELVINEDEGYGYRKMKIVLLPSEFVGESITEVGLGLGNYLHTHAILQDSEGNSVSINKTDVDEITIYATLYGRGEMGNGSVVSVTEGTLNGNLTNIHGGNRPDSIRVAESGHNSNRKSSVIGSTYDAETIGYKDVIYDEVNMIRRCKARIGTAKANYLINAVGTDSCRIGLLESNFWNGTYWEGQIGVGDGTTTEFNTLFHTIDITRIENSVKVNGLEREVTLSGFRSDIELGSLIYNYGDINPYPYLSSGGLYPNKETVELDFTLSKEISMKAISGKSLRIGYVGVEVFYSLDGVNYINANVNADTSGFRSDSLKTFEFAPTPKARFYKVKLSKPGHGTLSSNSIAALNLIPNLPQKQIKFDIPPAVGEVITAKLWTDGIPKDDKHVLDVTIDLKFKDGGAI